LPPALQPPPPFPNGGEIFEEQRRTVPIFQDSTNKCASSFRVHETQNLSPPAGSRIGTGHRGLRNPYQRFKPRGRRIRECFSPQQTRLAEKRSILKIYTSPSSVTRFLIVNHQGYFRILCTIWRCKTRQRDRYNTAFGRSELKECPEKRDANH
jgi:hypothetical protein